VESDDWNGPAYQTCVQYANVSRTFKTSNRRLLLSFQHHRVLASLKLKPTLVDELLDWCEAPLFIAQQLPSFCNTKINIRY
jgi:hypothetical protein